MYGLNEKLGRYRLSEGKINVFCAKITVIFGVMGYHCSEDGYFEFALLCNVDKSILCYSW